MIYDRARHEPLKAIPWDARRVQASLREIIADTEAHFSAESYWPPHPQDVEDSSRAALTPLYFGAIGVIWALRHLRELGAVAAIRDYGASLASLRQANQRWLGEQYRECRAAFLMGDTPVLMLQLAQDPHDRRARDELEQLILGNIDHPTRELMWGAPGTMLAAWFLYRHTRDERWAEAFRLSANRLWSQLQWSAEHGCQYFTQDLYGRRSTYLDAVHGFVATACVLISGRELLARSRWQDWHTCIVNTIARTATRQEDGVNWRVFLDIPADRPGRFLMQFCHGAPGFVVCLGDLPGAELDELLCAAGESIWAAGPLIKGANLCHGTGGNGYAFLKLYRRTGEPRWLERARAFAMHGIAQTEADRERYGQGRYSLWTGDPGFAIYLWHCLQGTASFPTLDVF